MEQIVDPAQGVRNPEFFSENPLGLFGPQGADAIGLDGLRQKTLFERGFFPRRQVRRATGLSLGDDRVEPPIPVHIRPALHEGSAASQDACDGGSIVTFECQQSRSIPISLLGVPLLTASLTQVFEILWMVQLDVHPTVPPVFSRVCQMLGEGATLF
jgi:hypothetical protein